MRKLLLLLALCGCAAAQSTNLIDVIPNAAGSAVGVVHFWDTAQTNYLAVVSPATLSANATLTLPVPTGTAGCVQDSTGAGVLTIASCSALTPPVTISGSSSSPILTVVQGSTGQAIYGYSTDSSATASVIQGNAVAPSVAGVFGLSSNSAGYGVQAINNGGGPSLVTGAGNVGIGMTSPAFLLDVNGAENLHGNLSVSADNTYGIGGPSLAPSVIYTHLLDVLSTSELQGLVTENSSGYANWYNTASGLAFAQDYTSRYVFDSIGDVPQTGTVNTSGTTATATSGTFDQSFVGGQLLICPGGCTGTNGSLYLISALVSSTQVTLATSPGTLTGAGYSYQANAFQTSLGTMYITGSGFGYLQNLVVTDGFTSYGAGSGTGVVNTSGTSVTWVSGQLFNLSMQGGYIDIPSATCSTLCVVSAVLTPTQITLTSSAGTHTGVSFSYTANAFQISNHSAWIDPSGNAFFQSGNFVSNLYAGAQLAVDGPTTLVGTLSAGTTGTFQVSAAGNLTVTNSSGTAITVDTSGTAFYAPFGSISVGGAISSGSGTSSFSTLDASTINVGVFNSTGSTAFQGPTALDNATIFITTSLATGSGGAAICVTSGGNVYKGTPGC